MEATPLPAGFSASEGVPLHGHASDAPDSPDTAIENTQLDTSEKGAFTTSGPPNACDAPPNYGDGSNAEIAARLPSGSVQAAARYWHAHIAPGTRRQYERGWAAFQAWCATTSVPALPAAPLTVGVYASHLAEKGLSVSTLRVALAAIGWAHKEAGHASPARHPDVERILEGILRTHGRPPERVEALLADDLHRVLAAAGNGSLRALRDRALVLTGWLSGLRRSELAALQVSDVHWQADGVVLHVPRSKGDQHGHGRDVACPAQQSDDTCPVRALRAWLDASKVSEGPLFRSVGRLGTVGPGLDPDSIGRIVRQLAVRAGLSGRYAGHSLRAGVATEAARRGKPAHDIRDKLGHKSLAATDHYLRAGRLLADDAAVGLL